MRRMRWDSPTVTGGACASENLKPEAPFDTVVVRALAPLPQMLAQVAPLCGAEPRAGDEGPLADGRARRAPCALAPPGSRRANVRGSPRRAA